MRWLLTFPEDLPSVPVYESWIRRAGVDAQVLHSTHALPADLSPYAALLLPGGGDVEPSLYGAPTRHPRTYGMLPEQDARELHLIQAFRMAGKPVYGICRGLQILNVAFGGGLIQHIPDVLPEKTERHRKRGSYDAKHPLVWDTSTRLGWRLRMAESANSAHHQCIDPHSLGRGLVVSVRSAGGIIEAVECFTGPAPVVAVQWHPERLPPDHPASRGLMELFCTLARAL